MSNNKTHNLVVSNLTRAQVTKVLDALYDVGIVADLAEKCDNCGGQFALVFMEDVDFAHYGNQRFCCHCAGHYYDSLPEPFPLVSSKESPILEYEKEDYLLLSKTGDVLAVSGNSEFSDGDNPSTESGMIVQVVEKGGA
tara:strand:- start:608 stop:1024 length:417 start_codon:yes stop_codon:yes gene_type:complete